MPEYTIGSVVNLLCDACANRIRKAVIPKTNHRIRSPPRKCTAPLRSSKLDRKPTLTPRICFRSNQSVVVIALRHEVEKMARTLNDALRVRRSGRDIHADGTLDDNFLVAYLELDLQPGELGAGADGDMLRVAVVRVLVDVVGLSRMHVGHAAHDRVETRFRFQL